jgi:hypothetical protein
MPQKDAMGIKADFKEAERILARLSMADKERLRKICAEIQAAEAELLDRAGPAMERCIHTCQGLCCRNIQLEAIIGVWDLVYILTVAGEYRDRMAACLEKEIPFYASDCIFLADCVGPCILPDTARAEVCLTTFCSGADTVEREIRKVKRRFYKLGWFLVTRTPRRFTDMIRRYLSSKPPVSY